MNKLERDYWIPPDIAFYPINIKARAKMAGIANKVYW